MRVIVLAAGFLAVSSCGGDAETDLADTGDRGGCGAVTEHIVTVRAAVVDRDEVAVPGATVRLEERNWEPGVLAEGTTDAEGEVVLEDVTITGVADCWGTAVDYALVATEADRRAEERINPSLFNAVDTGSDEVDRRSRPMVLE